MDNIISENKNSNKKIIIYSGVATIIMFVIMGNLSLITTLFNGEVGFGKDYVLKKGFSLSILDVAFLYIALGYFTYMILKKKKFILRNYVKAEVKSESILIKELKFISKVICISTTLNLIIKTLLYFIFKKTLISSFNIGGINLLLSLIYMTLVVSIVYLLVLISYVAIRDFFCGTLAYCLIFAMLNLVLSTGTLFISEKIAFIGNLLSLIYSLYNPIMVPFYDFSYLYTFNILTNIGTILVLGIIVSFMYYNLKNLIKSLDKKSIKEFYISNSFRKAFYLSIAVMLGYFVFLIGFLLLISFSLVDYDNGLLIINLAQVTISIFIYFKLNKYYLNKKNNKVFDSNKTPSKGEILPEVKQSGKNLDGNHTLNEVKSNKDIIIKNKEILDRTLVFKPIGLGNEIKDCEKIKDFSFDELDECLINEEKLDYVLDNKDKSLKNEILSNKDIEVTVDNEKLVDFLKEDIIRGKS
ncbi:MAG: hypothetical protein Q4B63_03395 [Clostridium perfringens]|nr:hypothetical protein [Clostridium perfringens]